MSVLSEFWHALLGFYFRTFHRLAVEEFTAPKQSHVVGFNCGHEEWETPLSTWITGQKVLEDMAPPRSTKVWLYKRRGRIVGYGSIGKTWRPYPVGGRDFIWVALIPMVAMQIQYHRKPKLAGRNEKYSGQILFDLIEQARQYNLPDLLLYVDPRNTKAKGLYRKWGFQFMGLNRDGLEIMAIKL